MEAASAAAASAKPTTFASLLDDPAARATDLEKHLDGLSSEERVRQCRALSGKQMARLYEVTKDGSPLPLEAFVPAELPDGQPVRFAGKNSLPTFTHFEKHFARVAGTAGKEIVGINVQAMSFVTGPGYFTIAGADEKHPGEVLFDYTRVPAERPSAWPAPKSNRRGFSYFVYRDMHDWNRRVSKDVVIGCATRLGQPIGQYYVLARLP